MHKKLIAIAIAGAVAAPLTATAEATIYGKMHVSVDAFNNDDTGAGNEGHHDGKDRDIWSIGAGFGMGNNTIKAQYSVADEHDDYNGISGDDTGASKWSVGIDHKMSKKTKVYAMYSALDNDDNVGVPLTHEGGHGDEGPNAGSIAAGADPSAFSVGLVHKF